MCQPGGLVGGLASEVGVAGFEPATSALSGQRSNQLSYTPFGRGVHQKCTGGKQPICQTAGAASLKTGGKKGNHGLERPKRPLAGLTYEYLLRKDRRFLERR